MKIIRGGTRLAGLVLCGLLAACGGGGGGGGSGGGSSSSASSSGVTVSTPQPGSIKQNVVLGMAMPNLTLSGTVSGDVASLNGKGLYVVVEDPASLFQSNAYVSYYPGASGYLYNLSLTGRVQSVAGHYTGNLRIFACLDPACQQPLGGTPFTVGYDVTVEAGITLSSKTVSITAPFGSQPTAQPVTVNWFSGAWGWSATNVTVLGADGFAYTSASHGADSHSLLIGASVAPVGSYTEKISVKANGLIPGTTMAPEEFITVKYTVTPSAVQYVMNPTSLSLTRSASDPLVAYHNHQLTLGSGVSLVSTRVEYTGGSSATGPVNSWWDESPMQSRSHVCVGINYGTQYDCLQPGVYTARVVYTLSTASGNVDAIFPITLTVTP